MARHRNYASEEKVVEAGQEILGEALNEALPEQPVVEEAAPPVLPEEQPVVEEAPAEEAQVEAAPVPQRPKPRLPGVPSRQELKQEGWSREESRIICEYMQAMHDEINALPAEPVKMFHTPGLRISSKRSGGFWVCGRQVKAGVPWEVPLSELSAKHLSEIKTVKDGNLIAVEEIMVEVER